MTQRSPERKHGYPRVLAPPPPMHNFNLIGDDVKSAGSIYQQLELAVSRSSGAPAQAARSCKLPSQKSLAHHPSPPAKVSKMSVRVNPLVYGLCGE